LVLEAADKLGAGATGHSAGLLSPGVNVPLGTLSANSSAAQLWRKTVETMQELVRESDKARSLLQAKRTGALDIATSKNGADRLRHEAISMKKHGITCELISRADVKVLTGNHVRTKDIRCALWLPDNGRIQPLTLLAHMATKARAAGVHIAGEAKVKLFKSRIDGLRWKVQLDNGMEIKARKLVLATGPTKNPTSRIYAMSFDLNLPDDFPMFWDSNPYTYYDYRFGDGKVTTSGGCFGKPGASSSSDQIFFQRIVSVSRYWLPALEGKTPTHTWAVDLKVSADTLPKLRTLNGRSKGFAIDGLGALGILPGIVLGRRVADKLFN
jgi:glycine/D-amino acid oxidase-like deaminating enzyme